MSEQIPPTDQNIRAVAHNALTKVLPEHMRFSDRIRVSEAVAAAVEPLIRASEREACAQMAEQMGAGYYTREAILSGGIHPSSYEPFADLLREES